MWNVKLKVSILLKEIEKSLYTSKMNMLIKCHLENRIHSRTYHLLEYIVHAI